MPVNVVHHHDVPSTPRNKECPTCRKKLVSRRSLRRDSNFDALISKIYPSRDEYEAHQRRVLERLNRLHNKEALSSSIEEGLRQQARYRSVRGGAQLRGQFWLNCSFILGFKPHLYL